MKSGKVLASCHYGWEVGLVLRIRSGDRKRLSAGRTWGMALGCDGCCYRAGE